MSLWVLIASERLAQTVGFFAVATVAFKDPQMLLHNSKGNLIIGMLLLIVSGIFSAGVFHTKQKLRGRQ